MPSREESGRPPLSQAAAWIWRSEENDDFPGYAPAAASPVASGLAGHHRADHEHAGLLCGHGHGGCAGGQRHGGGLHQCLVHLAGQRNPVRNRGGLLGPGGQRHRRPGPRQGPGGHPAGHPGHGGGRGHGAGGHGNSGRIHPRLAGGQAGGAARRGDLPALLHAGTALCHGAGDPLRHSAVQRRYPDPAGPELHGQCPERYSQLLPHLRDPHPVGNHHSRCGNGCGRGGAGLGHGPLLRGAAHAAHGAVQQEPPALLAVRRRPTGRTEPSSGRPCGWACPTSANG